jgi:hypothetical protein
MDLGRGIAGAPEKVLLIVEAITHTVADSSATAFALFGTGLGDGLYR